MNLEPFILGIVYFVIMVGAFTWGLIDLAKDRDYWMQEAFRLQKMLLKKQLEKILKESEEE